MYEYEEGIWETKDHKKIKIKDMETSHIKNTIKFLKQRPYFYDTGCCGSDVEEFDYDDNSHLVDKKIEELQYELENRRLRWI